MDTSDRLLNETGGKGKGVGCRGGGEAVGALMLQLSLDDGKVGKVIVWRLRYVRGPVGYGVVVLE